MKTKILVLALVLCLVLAIVFGCLYYNLRPKYEWRQKGFDILFQGNLARIVSNLRTRYDEDSAEKLDDENLKYSYLCMSVYAYTSYASPSNEKLNAIVYRLKRLCEEETLYETIDDELVIALDQMCLHLNEQEYIDRVYAQLFEQE